MNLINTYAYNINQKIIFKISIPLVSTNNYDLYNLIPLPVHSTNRYISIHPKQRYLAYSTTKIHYTLLHDLTDCKLIIEYEFLCSQNHIIYLTHSIPICEIELLTSSSIPKSCIVQETHQSLNLWQKLSSINSWLFVLSSPTILTLSCNDKTSDIKLSNTGILELPAGCKGYSSNLILTTEDTKLSNFYSIIPPIDIIHDNCCDEIKLNDSIHIPLLSPIHFSDKGLEDLRLISNRINTFSKNIDDLLDQSHVKRYTNTYDYILYVIYFVIFFIILLKLSKPCRRAMLRNRIETVEPLPSGTSNINNIFQICFKPHPNDTNDNDNDIELENIPSPPNESPLNQSTPLRRSSRLSSRFKI